MKITLDPRKSLLQNIALYREAAKKYRQKAVGAEKAILETVASVEKQAQYSEQAHATAKKHNDWFNKFLHFKTASGSLVVAGRNAKQNDVVFAKHALPEEFFFHADIRGSPAVIVKNPNATQEELQEAAQFTASFSSAWKREFGSVDVYALRVSQVSKHSHGGYIEQGAFVLAGERQWFKNTLVGLYLCLDENTLEFSLRPLVRGKTALCVKLMPGKSEKNALAKSIKAYFAKKLFAKGTKTKFNEEDIAKLLPGNCEAVYE
ncbi:MAG: NFACT RNA binding domain-containing protein [Candidatus Micrarchaeota archaeon]